MFQASTTTPFGRVLLQTPTTTSIDQRDMFSLYLFAGPDKSTKVGLQFAKILDLGKKIGYIQILDYATDMIGVQERSCFLLSI